MDLGKVWKNKWKILEGIWNSINPSEFVEEVAAKRIAICETNECGFYSKGDSKACTIPGKPCCAGCGCVLQLKGKSLSSSCYLEELGEKPLWTAIMTQEDEDKFRTEYNIKEDA